MDNPRQSLCDTDSQRQLDLATKAFRDFYAQCFWSYREDAEITEEKIPFVIRGLRKMADWQATEPPPRYANRGL